MKEIIYLIMIIYTDKIKIIIKGKRNNKNIFNDNQNHFIITIGIV